MTRFAPAAVVFTTLLAASASPAQSTAPFTDPANLRGERVSPRTGRELPIDGGDPAQQTLALQQQLRRLNTRASLMLIVAHPDDEDGGMLTFYSRGLGARVAMLTLTRGEGGQNAMTGDFEDALGLLRTQELLSADRYSGVQQMFGTEVDFGFSKTKAEAFAKWDHQRVLYDAVRAVRLFRPLVIAAVFTGSVTDGHGQHQVSGQIAQEVFKAAADPNVFPELTREGIAPWQPLKVYARVPFASITDKGLFDYATGQYVPAQFRNYVTGETFTSTPAPDVVIHEGQTDPLLTYAAARPEDLHTKPTNVNEPLSYVQFARIGLGLQRSQIGQGVRVPPAGRFDVAYHRYASVAPSQQRTETSFFDGIDATLTGYASLAPSANNKLREQIANLALAISALTAAFEQDHDADSLAPKIADTMQSLDRLTDAVSHAAIPSSQREDLLHELRVKRVQLNSALALSLQLQFDATAHGVDQVANDTIPIYLQVKTGSSHDLLVKDQSVDNARGISFKLPASLDNKGDLTAAHPVQRSVKVDSSVTANITRPYFTRDSIESPVYKLLDASLRNSSATPAALTAWTAVDYRGTIIQLGRVLHDGPQPVSIVPAASIAIAPHAQILPNEHDGLMIRTFSSPNTQPAAVTARLTTPRGWKASLATGDHTQPGESLFDVTPPANAHATAIITATAVLHDKRSVTEGYRPIGYDDLPHTNYFTSATDRIVPSSLKLPEHIRIGYVPGTGDAAPEALNSLRLPATTLAVADLTPAKLANFDTVILGVRTYAAHPDLHGAPTRALIDFARNGGNVVVQYQTTEFRSDDAPFPLDLGSNEKVVDETTPVHLLDTSNQLLTTPNKITPADFNNWIEERGHGFLSTWDAHYTALAETHDPGEPTEFIQPQAPQRGGLITTPLGKGRWTYVAFALYRQLPEAVPGAFRLFINLITPPPQTH